MARWIFAVAATRGNNAGVDFFTCAVADADLRRWGVPAQLKRVDQGARRRTGDPRSNRGMEHGVLPVVAFVDGDVEFVPAGDDEITRNLGRLLICAPEKIEIIDGFVPWVVNDGPVGDNAVPTVVIPDPGFRRFARTRAAMAKAGPTPRGLVSAAQDRRFRAARIAERVMASVPFFRDLTETEKSTISNRSVKMFTLSGIRNATAALLVGLDLQSEQERVDTAVDFWTEVGKNIPEWQLAAGRRVSAADLRRDFIHAHTLALAAIARAGNQLLASKRRGWRVTIKGLTRIDWRRGNTSLWEGRAMNAGRLSKHNVNVTLTANVVKKHLGLPLSPAENATESEFRKMRKSSTPSKP
jgi:DNA sulfur modification protein DndB